MLKGILHVHSTWSDGEYSLPELRQSLLRSGFDFACMTDHAQFFDAGRAGAYAAECQRLSDDRFLFISGLEYECQDRMHILGLGVATLTDLTDPQGVIAHIENLGGISIIAHPPDSAFARIESFQRLPRGIEAWNTKSDGRYAPRPPTFELIRRLRRRKGDLLAFYGVDLHFRAQFRGLRTEVDCSQLSPASIISALDRGQYLGVKDELRLPSDGVVNDTFLQRFQLVHHRSDRMRRLVKGTKSLMDRMGVAVPKALKRQLRRIF